MNKNKNINNTQNEKWSYKKIHSSVRGTAFKRGAHAWLLLVTVCFVFSFISANSSESVLMKLADKVIGSSDVSEGNLEIIDTYIAENFKDNKLFRSDVMISLCNSLSQKHSWLVNILAANFAYFKRNSGEVVGILLLAGILLTLKKLITSNIIELGLYRYTMECRYQKEPKIRRAFAHMHRRYLINEFVVMFMYRLLLTLWMFTIVGLPSAYYRYKMVPYILMENPKIKWRQALKLSAKMTKGYKMKMFLTDLSYLHIRVLNSIPILSALVCQPMISSMGAEIYFVLREKADDRDMFIEKAFDASPYLETNKSADGFELKDTVLSPDELRANITTNIKRLRGEYNLIDYILFFFAFGIVGWTWEVLLYIVRDHVLVNRGTMYGPWLPIYAVGGTIIVFMLGHFKDNKIKLFAMAMLLCGVIEYAASWMLEYFNNSSYWDYKDYMINVNGRISLIGLTAFGIGGLFGVYIAAPRISLIADKLGKKKSIILCSVLIALFVLDLICCAVFGFNSGEGVGVAY